MNKIFNKFLLGILCASLIIIPYTKVYAANDKNDENEETLRLKQPKMMKN